MSGIENKEVFTVVNEYTREELKDIFPKESNRMSDDEVKAFKAQQKEAVDNLRLYEAIFEDKEAEIKNLKTNAETLDAVHKTRSLNIEIERDKAVIKYGLVLEENVKLNEQLSTADVSLEKLMDSEAELVAKNKFLATENERLLSVVEERNGEIAKFKAPFNDCDGGK